jgi:hypothetical protein
MTLADLDVGDAVLFGVRSPARRNAVSRCIFPRGLGINTMSGPNAVWVRHDSRAPPNAGIEIFLIVVFADAFPAGREVGHLHLTGALKPFGGAQRNAA